MQPTTQKPVIDKGAGFNSLNERVCITLPPEVIVTTGLTLSEPEV